MRTDGGQMDTLFTANLLYKCKSQGMTLKLNNRFENNIIADVISPRGVYLKIVEGPMTGASNKRNIYYCKADRSRSDSVLRKLQSDGVDANSQAVDPMFVDPENGDFRFKPGSPALELGIVPIDLSQVGLRNTGH